MSNGRNHAGLDLLNIDQPDPLLVTLIARKGDMTYLAFAAEIGLTESMLRAYMTGHSDAGWDTLCILAAWDPSYEPMIIERMRVHGQQLRARSLSRQLRTQEAA